MLPTITEKSKSAFKAAAEKLGISTELPDLGILRPDLALYLTATYMLAVIIEAGKDGEIRDYNYHSVRKYYPWHYAENGYESGSSGGGFSFDDYDLDHDSSSVGARLTLNNPEAVREICKNHPELWEIVKLDCR